MHACIHVRVRVIMHVSVCVYVCVLVFSCAHACLVWPAVYDGMCVYRWVWCKATLTL